jgi:hypothetical protein
MLPILRGGREREAHLAAKRREEKEEGQKVIGTWKR